MTDAEIIKALECCSQETYDCDNCPLNKTEESLCFIEIKKYALDIITRQKAEIEKLKSGIVVELDNYASEYDSKIKAEAVKEFAERLEDEAYGNDLYDRSGYPVKAVTVADVENVKKEMAGVAE